MVFSSFIQKPKKTHYDGEDKGEKIQYVLRRSFITNYSWITIAGFMLVAPFVIDIFLATLKFEGEKLVGVGFILVFTLFWYLATFGLLLMNFLLWFFNVYIITDKKILDMDFHGLLYKNISEATLDNIEDVTSNVKGTFGVIFNIGDVFIQTAAEQREFEFHGIHNPAKVRDMIADLVHEIRKRGGHRRRNRLILED
jgi:hypothetical protein